MSDSFSYSCPECGTGLKVRPEWVGKKARCRKCQARFRIDPPDPESVPDPEPIAPEPEPEPVAAPEPEPVAAPEPGRGFEPERFEAFAAAVADPGFDPFSLPPEPVSAPESDDPADGQAPAEVGFFSAAAGDDDDIIPMDQAAPTVLHMPHDAEVEGTAPQEPIHEPPTERSDPPQTSDGPLSLPPDQLFSMNEVAPEKSTKRTVAKAAKRTEPTFTQKAAELPRPTIPGYEILGELGRGGMGVVYKAMQTSLGRLVAIKMVLGGQHAGSEELSRFRAEAEAVARLQHPGIVQIYEIDQHQGHPFFTLEFIEGGSLTGKMTGPMASIRAAALVEQLARAIHFAHQRGIVHRDLKPANVLLTKDGVPKITDFGLAKKYEEDSHQTKTGAVMGTPSYMAPEQAEGRNKDIGPPADVYALGAILYDLITGRPPFQGKTSLDTLFQVLSNEPVPPTRLQKKIPRDLETICLKCLQKDPTKRYPSADALAEDLRRFAAGEPIAARPVGSMERTIKWVKRRPALAGLALVSVLAVVAGVLLYNAELRASVERQRLDAETAKREKGEADSARAQAEQAREAARRQEAQARRFLYAANMTLAQQAWDLAQVGRMRQILSQHLPAPDSPEIRGFEWHLLWRLCRSERFALEHGARVGSIALSTDGNLLVEGGNDRRVLVWDMANRQVKHTLPEQGGGITAVALDPAGKLLATSAYNSPVRLWDPATGSPLRDLTGHTGAILCLSFSANGRLVAGGGTDKAVRFWSTADGARLANIANLPGEVNAAAFIPEAPGLVAVATSDGSLAVWDLGDASGPRRRAIVKAHNAPITALAVSRDGNLIAVGSHDRTAKVFERTAMGLRERATLTGHTNTVYGLAFTADGESVATASWDRSVRLWDALKGNQRATLKGHDGGVLAVAYSTDGKTLVTAGDDGFVKVWDADLGREFALLSGHAGRVNCVAFTADGTRLISGGSDATLRVGSVDGGGNADVLQDRSLGVTSLLLTPDGRPVSADRDGSIRVWDLGGGKVHISFDAHKGTVNALAATSDGRKLVSGGYDNAVKLWELPGGREIKTLGTLPAAVRAVAVSADGSLIIAAGRDGDDESTARGVVRIWDGSGKDLGTLSAPTREVTCLAISPDGSTLAGGSLDGTLRLWDLATRKPIAVLQGHAGSVRCVVFSADGLSLASGSDDGTVRLWDPRHGQPRSMLDYGSPVLGLAISPDGKSLAAAGGDRMVRVWKGSPEAPPTAAVPVAAAP